MDYLWVGLGGILGALTRFGLGQLLLLAWGSSFPYGTLLINITGSMLLGMIQTLVTERMLLSPRFCLLGGVGFCGAYTTFSTFTRETLVLLQQNQPATALLYMSCSLLICLFGTWMGIISGRRLFASHRDVLTNSEVDV